MDYHKYPVRMLELVQEFYKTLRSTVGAKDDLTFIQDDPFQFEITGKDDDWYFIVLEPILDSKEKLSVTWTKRPRSANDISSYKERGLSDVCLTSFNSWYALIKRYDQIKINPEEERLKQYEEEFFEELKIIDEDADTAAFKQPQQLLLYKYYEYAEKLLEEEIKNGEPVEHLKKEATELKENIQNSTKTQAIKGLSRFLAKVQKAGIKYLNPVWMEGKKEIIKRGINFALDHAADVYKLIEHGFNSIT